MFAFSLTCSTIFWFGGKYEVQTIIINDLHNGAYCMSGSATLRCLENFVSSVRGFKFSESFASALGMYLTEMRPTP